MIHIQFKLVSINYAQLNYIKIYESVLKLGTELMELKIHTYYEIEGNKIESWIVKQKIFSNNDVI